MASHAQSLLQAKVFALLTGDATLTGLLAAGANSVMDTGAEDGKAFPFITIGEAEFSNWSTHTNEGFRGDFTVNTWSTKPGRKETQTIMNRIHQLLHNVNLGLTGFTCIACYSDFDTILVDKDMRGHHGVQKFNFQLSED